MEQTQTQITVTADFEITGWVETPWDEHTAGPKLARATVHKRFSGGLEGTSVAELVTAQGEGGNAYVAIERVQGAMDGRRGTFVLQHHGLDAAGEATTSGRVVPGSGTGDLRELRGEVVFAHDATGAHVVLTVSF